MLKFNRRIWCLSCLIGTTLLGGCVPALLGESPITEDVAPQSAPNTVTSIDQSTADRRVLGLRNWKSLFRSPSLQALLDQALKTNQELNIQLQELLIAKADIRSRQGDLLPKIRIDTGVGADKISKQTSQGVSDEANGLGSMLGDFRFGLVGAWEVDIWGKLRQAVSAADKRYLASVEARHWMKTQLIAEVANSYYDLLALDNRREVLTRNIALQKRALELIKVEKQAARVTELAVKRFEAEVARNDSSLYELQQEIVQVENRINFLIGKNPQRVFRQKSELDVALPYLVGMTIPSEWLKYRPDVSQAEYELTAARLDVSIARANFFPSFSLDAGLGYRSFNLGRLLTTPEALVSNLAGSVSAPWVNRMAIEAQYRSADARQKQALIRYERTVLQALIDITNQLANVKNLRQAVVSRSGQVATLTQSVDLSTLLFRAARADYVEVLLTRRDMLEANLELIEQKKRLQQAVVRLYQALGGGNDASTHS